MSRYSTTIAAGLLAMSVSIFGFASPAQAQSCGNSITNPGEVCDNGGDNDTEDVGCCAEGCEAFVTAGTECRPAVGVCDTVAETCDGTSAACPANIVSPTSVMCRDSTGVCDPAEFCTGTSDACPANTFSSTAVTCRGAAGVCDVAENCDGSTGACPADVKAATTVVCRADAGSCDPGPEVCPGTGNDCPADSLSPTSTICRGSAGICDPAENCTGTSGACPANVLSPTSVTCRPSLAGVCDSAETCDGSSPGCPADTVAPSTTVCREAAGGCDAVETCDGSTGACPADAKQPSDFVCRADAGICDLGEEVCDGSSDDCPADVVSPAETVCRPSAGVCDAQEACDGSTGACPADAHTPGAVCRVSAGDCDLEEVCIGSANDCPADEKDTGAVCREAVNPACDVEEVCVGTSNDCPDDVLFECGDADGIACTEATCMPDGECVIADNCVEICRGPGYWQTHSGDEKGENVGQQILDEVGTLFVCGEQVTNTTGLDYLTASLEGLCMRTQGVKQRQLYRFLLTTAFNCAISEGGDCDQILSKFIDVSFSECSDVCEDGEEEGGPTLKDCKAQLGCFNGGGRWIDGDCVKGTCDGDGETYCSDDEDCAEEEECERFDDTCRSLDICSEDLDAPAQICPKKGPASSPKTCKVARKNDCTIDNCGPNPVIPDSCEGQCGNPSVGPSDCSCDPVEVCNGNAPGCADFAEFCAATCLDDSCENRCGGQAPSGCWCDSLSCGIDSCPDVDEFCTDCLPPPGSCAGQCGESGPFGSDECYCDELSCTVDDGCGDRDAECPDLCSAVTTTTTMLITTTTAAP